jgi:UDP-N-acetylmuramoyl-tripeptide--D-alanyl-D-alanine ligase
MSNTWHMSLREIMDSQPSVTVLGAKLGDLADAVHTVSTDSRSCEAGCLFVALKGELFDAHNFLLQVVERGARALMVEAGVTLPALPANVTVFVVPSTLAGLGHVANAWRQRFQLPMIAVTGSNGKTTVKEMIAAILRAAFDERCLSTQGNLNNEIGLPMTLLRLRKEHRAAVIEMGMNHPGEIARLAAIAQTTVAMVNNAQREHQEFMKTVEAVARENGTAIAMLPANGVAVFAADDEYTHVWQEQAGARKTLTFGYDERADVVAARTAQPDSFSMTVKGETVSVRLQIAGQHNVRNALAASACALAIGLDLSTIVKGLGQFLPAKGRLQSHPLPEGGVLIDDTYNANPDSVLAAIALLREKSPAILVLGDMGEVGEQGPQFHAEVGRAAAQAGLHALFTFGAATRATHEAYVEGSSTTNKSAIAEHYDAIDPLVAHLRSTLGAMGESRKSACVLVKGSRSMRMERVVQAMGNTARAEGAH